MSRKATIERVTKETQIKLSLEIDGTGEAKICTSVPFLDHMLDLFARHGLFNLQVDATGDIDIDFHHTVEDIGIVLGQALKEALGDKKGIRRYGQATVPMDETLASVAVDISGRPYLVYHVSLPKVKIGEFDVELVREFFQAVVNNLGANIHVNVMYGDNVHHIVEACFKAFARAVDQATQVDSRIQGVMSTKGKL
ncbi:imidazoleglycerol-phosphate dehydratase HisB [Geobacter sulfurreducens]|jgi:imidazoleglycerol-phosphate dehydratase|uniref:Imidazoleglycerol-phosphate dehydratase n=1 Tax=Geobacter sulfurreducens (strain ATCC 51573 / DSM 12127 / PCA) TaxID=243231 RepID=HIS7_GEOSL|nr:imidazoleglycerol-phosphate dehydratase HisB [Geobacter sulfurreducens]P60885.1 RecName: Full=Imidazoleglycerol-phosphate dehydratase; Short=IGPD [Geobacter sulfurreducens PCA]AAR36489.1 imidazoleglycerol-phosphate dehydratase [Geobacter sulfurreducens PCA]ADI85849.1 imidazoleglycerol-phosphate dehydratase [Geobacter sulfurreducens KN400]QVW34892.1 imidazoleglycerol-phosphate dehydratase HisB [Geobacter sulfurreducens]UAC03763.1 imidazoleglycerol-phosphate dehydratase HisB [Geobacter sulfur